MQTHRYITGGAVWALGVGLATALALAMILVQYNCIPRGDPKPGLALLALPGFLLTYGAGTSAMIFVLELLTRNSRDVPKVYLKRAIVGAAVLLAAIVFAFVYLRAPGAEHCAL